MSPGAPPRRTLWEEGRTAGRAVVLAAALLVLVTAGVDLLVLGGITPVTDIAFVLACVAAPLAVRPRDFFVVGICPPLLMTAVFGVLALTARGAFTDPADGFGQAVVSGLARHAGALAVGYGLTLALIGLRRRAIENSGTIRGAARHRLTDPHGRPRVRP